MSAPIDATALGVFIALFALVTVLGFIAARWHNADLSHINEWGLAGRRFGTLITWFLIGGDLYTAYTFIAVPAAVYGGGAAGFFAVPYTIVAYPFFFLIAPRLWNVCKRHSFVTAADFVEGRYGDRNLALAVAITGILATLPYIALQLIGMQVVISSLGIGGSGLAGDLPLFVAFVVLATYTYTSGLRAPAMIALVKDVMIYVTVVVAVVAVPMKLGGFAHVFAAADAAFAARPPGAPPASVILQPGAYWAYGTLAIGSAMALFLYPHAVTGILAASRGDAVRRNAVLLPAYSLALGLLALFGYMAIAAGLNIAKPNLAVPALIHALFPSWFAGFAFAAIAVGALVPAAIMSIAAANLWTRNIYKPFINPRATPQQEGQQAKLTSLVVKFGALAFVLAFSSQYAINLQLLGGVWMLQTLPAVVLGLFTRALHRTALLCGWFAGMATGTAMFLATGFKPTFALHAGGIAVAAYIAVEALAVNLLLAALLTPVFDRAGIARGTDATTAGDYEDEASAGLPIPTIA